MPRRARSRRPLNMFPGAVFSLSSWFMTKITSFAQTVTSHAYMVTDADVDALSAAGYSENAVFETVVSAAVGAGLARLEAGLTALEQAE